MSTIQRRSLLKALPFVGPALSRSVAQAQDADPVQSIQLEARQEWVTLGGRAALAFAYSRRVPGPAMELNPGERVVIDFRNALPEPTNLHFHGLHIPATGSADNMMIRVDSGAAQTYEFTLPGNHPGGTFWYHPHLHGAAAKQVSRGLAGPIIVRGVLDQIPEIAAAPEALFFLQDFTVPANGQFSEPGMMARMNGREGSLITVNGAANPVFNVQEQGWLRLRMVNASASRYYRVRLDQHPFHVIATDGGAIASPDAMEELLLAPGERIEVMIPGNRPAGDYAFWNMPYNRGGGNNAQRPTQLASLRYEGTVENPWTLPGKLVEIDPLPPPTMKRSFRLGESMMNFTINGRTFSESRIDTRVNLDSVEDWEFVNPTNMDHPIHIHTNPFQVLDANGNPIPVWKDTVNVRANSTQTLRIAFRDFEGVSLYHCHILDHEDLGMMGTVEIGRIV